MQYLYLLSIKSCNSEFQPICWSTIWPVFFWKLLAVTSGQLNTNYKTRINHLGLNFPTYRVSTKSVAALCRFVNEHQTDWDRLVNRLWNSYNAQVQRTKGTTHASPFQWLYLLGPRKVESTLSIIANMSAAPDLPAFWNRFLQKCRTLALLTSKDWKTVNRTKDWIPIIRFISIQLVRPGSSKWSTSLKRLSWSTWFSRKIGS